MSSVFKHLLSILHRAVTTLVLADAGHPRARGRGGHDISHSVLPGVAPAMCCFARPGGTLDWSGLVFPAFGSGSGAQM